MGVLCFEDIIHSCYIACSNQYCFQLFVDKLIFFGYQWVQGSLDTAVEDAKFAGEIVVFLYVGFYHFLSSIIIVIFQMCECEQDNKHAKQTKEQ